MYLLLCAVQWGSYSRQEKGKQTRVFPTMILLCSLWIHPPWFKGCFMDRESNQLCCTLQIFTGTASTLRAQHCPTSLAYAWNLLFPTKLPPILQNQNRKMCRKLSPQLGFQQIHLQWIHTQTASSSLALTLESSNWEVPMPVRLICLNSTNFFKKWKNMPTLTCDSTLCYTCRGGGEARGYHIPVSNVVLKSRALFVPRKCWERSFSMT